MALKLKKTDLMSHQGDTLFEGLEDTLVRNGLIYKHLLKQYEGIYIHQQKGITVMFRW